MKIIIGGIIMTHISEPMAWLIVILETIGLTIAGVLACIESRK
jgi:hypothetical protein